MPRALLTGVTGQDGGYLSELLLARGVEVWGLSSGADAAVPGVTVRRADLRSAADVERVVADVAPDLVVNLAAVSSVMRSWAEPELTMDVNALGLVRLVEAVKKHVPQARVVQAGSAEMFDEDVPLQDETTTIRPGNPYGVSKAAAHHAVQAYRASGVDISSAILFNHESPRRPPTFVTRKITSGVAAIARGTQEHLVLGNLDARRDWGWAPDYVDALVRAARADVPTDYVVATGEGRSVRDFVAAAFDCVGIDDWEGLVTTDPRFVRPTDAVELTGDATRLRTTLDWKPTVAFDELVRRMVEADRA